MKAALIFFFALLAGCTQANPPAPQPQVDEAFFRCDVQPVITKYCSTFACHGDARRYFHVFARNRLRAQGTEAERNAALTEQEMTSNFESARAMLSTNGPSLLLQKPLEQDAGGWYHRGATLYGEGNVFSSADDPEYRVLGDWAAGKKEDPTCVEPGSQF